MSRILEINGKEYKLEFTIEASLYKDCTEKVTGFMSNVASAEDGEDNKGKIKDLISTMSDIPQTTLTMFYAGLMEHHGTEEGDGEVPDKKTAKILLKSYIKENNGNFWSVMEMLLDQMGEDGFFKLIGLEEMMSPMTEEKEPKKPQDHKKKQPKVSESE